MHPKNRPFRLTAAVAVAALLLGQALPRPVLAQGAPPPSVQPGPQDQQQGDPPERVGRLARVSGTVSFHAQGDEQWSPATANYPVSAGNAFWTEPNAQAEIEVSASRIVMAPATELDVATLTDTAFRATVPQGEVYVRLQPAAPDETYAVQTPRGLVTLAAPGRYGVSAGDTQNPTMVTVVEGSAQISAPGVALDVAPDQTASITGTDTFEGNIGPPQRDAFLTAMLDRERPPPQQAAAPRQPVAPPPIVAAMPGGDDLAEYGSWSESPDYGQVWYPQVAQDWVPYRDGQWAYVAPWGWTWVDRAPWGFAPFHYGRWAEFGGRWGWIPGAERGGFRRPVYAPALVTFLGVGAVGVGVGAALAAGRIGWLPLGPREPFHPWYHASNRYFGQVNGGSVTNIATINRNVTVNNFANRRFATVVPTSVMTASRPVGTAFQRVDPAQLAQARPVIGQQPLRPSITTVGVTPTVARQLNLPATAGLRPGAPGPNIRATSVVVSPGAAAGATGHPVVPMLATPGSGRPITAQPGGAPGPAITPGGAPGPGFIGRTPTPNLTAPGGAPGPAITPRAGTPALATPGGTPGPGFIGRTPTPNLTAPGGAAGPAVTSRTGTPTVGTPGTPSVGPNGTTLSIGPAPNRVQPFTAAPGSVQHLPPAGVGGSPSIANPGGGATQFRATPLLATPAPQVHTPTPQFQAPPPPVVHAPPPPLPAVVRAPPPPPQFHPPPPPAAIVRAPPPPPPPQAPARQAPQENAQHKRPGEL